MLTGPQLFFKAVQKSAKRPYAPFAGRKIDGHGDFTCIICGRSYVNADFFALSTKSKKKVISDTFGEFGFLKTLYSDHICIPCELAWRQPHFSGVKAFIVWEDDFRIAISGDGDKDNASTRYVVDMYGSDKIIESTNVINYLLDPPQSPFLISLGHPSGKQHSLPFSIVNYDKDYYYVNCKNEIAVVNRKRLAEYYAAEPKPKLAQLFQNNDVELLQLIGPKGIGIGLGRFLNLKK